MSEPSEEELERAERIRKLRSGGARSRSHEMRERRREQADDRDRPPADGTGADEAGPDAEAGDGPGDAGEDAGDEQEAGDGDDDQDAAVGLGAAGDTDVLQLAADLPADGSLFVVPVREELRREFNKVAEQVHLRYGFEYGGELDIERHVRPLALYLGVQALEDADVEVVRELLDSVDELDAPEPVEEG